MQLLREAHSRKKGREDKLFSDLPCYMKDKEENISIISKALHILRITVSPRKVKDAAIFYQNMFPVSLSN